MSIQKQNRQLEFAVFLVNVQIHISGPTDTLACPLEENYIFSSIVTPLLIVRWAVSVKLETTDLVCEIKFLVLSNIYTGYVASSQKQKRRKRSSLSYISQLIYLAMLTYFFRTAHLFLQYFSRLQQLTEYVKIFWCVSSQVVQPHTPMLFILYSRDEKFDIPLNVLLSVHVLFLQHLSLHSDILSCFVPSHHCI